MAKTENFDRLPPGYDPRLTVILRDPVPDDVLVSFYYMAASKSPSANYRWELHRDGTLFYVEHTGKNLTFENTFDRRLPRRPRKVLSKEEILALYEMFDQTGFFDQPGLQRASPTEGGAYVIVRARRNGDLHEVVYENIETPLVKYLYTIIQ